MALTQGMRQLGAGVGLCGLVAAGIGAAQVTLTDRADAPPVLANLSRNVALNSDLLSSSRVVVMGLTWGLFTCSHVSGIHPLPDVLIAADCFYDSPGSSHHSEIKV